MSRTPDFYRRDSAIDPAEAAEVPSRAPGRARRLTVTAVIAGGLVLGGTAIAYAGTTTAPTSGDSSSTTSRRTRARRQPNVPHHGRTSTGLSPRYRATRLPSPIPRASPARS